MEQNGINQLAGALVDFTSGIAESKVDNAQYDKSFNTVIWGTNRLFTDDVPQSTQDQLIKEYQIPETSEKHFYTFVIDGKYYVKESEKTFMLYQKVVIRVPNGNWDRMFIEGDENNKETTYPMKDIKISTGKIEYNGKEYRLQRGNDRKIIAVTHEKKCTRIYATTESESEAAAISAVIHGLDEPWDIEYDYYVSNDGYYIDPFNTQSACINSGYNSFRIIEVDYGDGSEPVRNYSFGTHRIEHKGYYRMRIKTDVTKLLRFGGAHESNWDLGKEIDPEKWEKGQYVYIGGKIESIEEIYGNAISHLTWGESVKYISRCAFIGSKTPLRSIDVGLPPYFISSDGPYQILYGAPVNYLYIPGSCQHVFHIGFGGLPLKTLEIEPTGESLMLDPGAFLQYDGTFSDLRILSIPPRVKFRDGKSNYSPFDGAGIQVLYLQRGVTEIVSGSFIDCFSHGLNIGNSTIKRANGDIYIYIPKTVTHIQYHSFEVSLNSIVNIIYEGSQYEWNNINKEDQWLFGRETPDNIAFNYYDSFNTLVENLGNKYTSGVGIEVTDMISLKPATKSTLGGIKVGDNIEISVDGTISASVKEYTAGENIEISDGGVISAIVREYKAGENIEISEDGTISAAAPGGAELTAGGGIAIETDAETGKRTVSAAVGEGAEIRDGKICTVPNIQTGILITEKDAKYLLHHFTETEYIAGNQIGYAGPGNQIVVQGYLAYPHGYITENATRDGNNNYHYKEGENWVKNYTTYMELSGDFYYLYNTTPEYYKKIYLELGDTNEQYMIFNRLRENSAGGISAAGPRSWNYNSWSGIGLSIGWKTIHNPGYTLYGVTLENGGITCDLFAVSKNGTEGFAASIGYNIRNWLMPFASLAEYQAAVGLTYEPLTLTEVADSLTVVSENDIQ